jgi:1-acyl-sn-glycerol-3-phosphate acyltransferase
VNALPFARQVQIRQSLDLCAGLLSNPGNVLILFPEGTRSANGELNPFKPGIGLLLAARDVPVLPCYLAGAFRAWPRNRLMPRPAKLTLVIGSPRSYERMPAGKESACAVAAELRAAVEELKQKYESH